MRTIDERSYTALKYAHDFAGAVDVTARIYYDRSISQTDYPLGPTLFTDKSEGEWWGAELQLNKRLWERHIVTVGAEYRDDFRQETASPPIQRDRQSHGVYAQGDFAVLTNLHLNAGMRYDQYGDFDPSFNPRVAVIYNPAEGSTLKALYGTAFRAPNYVELTSAGFGDNIRPEKITAYELVYEQEIGRHLRSSLSGFYNQMEDLIVFTDGGFTNFDAETKGMEVALQGFWTNGIRGRLSYTFQETENHSVRWEMPDSPGHLFKFNLSAPVWRDKIFAGLEFQYTSERRTLHTTTTPAGQLLTIQGENAGGFGVVNFTLFSQNLVKNLEFSVSVYNLLDSSYGDPASQYPTHAHAQDTIERDGRSFRLKLTYRF
jgi:iron complex outermembrane receptor protein